MEKRKIAIVGSRSFTDYDLMKSTIDLQSTSLIVSGGAIGADTLAEQLATEFNIPMLVFLPDYKTHGRKAPFVRNTSIVEAADIIFAFWDGKSTGTLDSIKKAKRLGKLINIVNFNLNSPDMLQC
jgi:hypothetical protein